MPYEGACKTVDIVAERSRQLRSKMRDAIARRNVEADEGQRQRLFIEYTTLFGLWLEYTGEHLARLDLGDAYGKARGGQLRPSRDCTAATSGSIAEGGNGETLLTLISQST